MTVVNGARCKKCGDIIQSRYKHDYVVCACGSISVGGGIEYCLYRYPSGNPDDWIEVIKTEDELIRLLEEKSANWTYVSNRTVNEMTKDISDKRIDKLKGLIKDKWGEEV